MGGVDLCMAGMDGPQRPMAPGFVDPDRTIGARIAMPSGVDAAQMPV